MEAANEAVVQQAKLVAQLKADKAEGVKEAVAKLLELKAALKVFTDEAEAKKKAIAEFREGFDSLMLRKFFFVNSFEIYGGVAGLFDYGPPGNALMQNLFQLWRNHFVLAESMLEVSCSCLNPDIVLRTSGHVDKFTDFMVRDAKTHECLRADKILEEWIDRLLEDPKKPVSAARREELLTIRGNADAYSQEELTQVLKDLDVKSPDTGNDITEPFPFNLMFATQIGPTGKLQGYLRPETAQGIFTNFKRLLEFNAGKMPFAAAQIGLGFRNEISPRSGLLRVREFMMGEIEHFVHPDQKDHPRFPNVKDQVMSLLCKADQVGEEKPRSLTIGQAVADGMVDNQTLGYYMARTHQFLVAAGIDEKRLRFRQHKDTEMAHYACDCWDAEIHTTYGWVEVAGHADRSAYDLKVHAAKSKANLMAQEALNPPQIVKVVEFKPNRGLIGKTFRKEAKKLFAALKDMEDDAKLALAKDLEAGAAKLTVDGTEFALTPDMLKLNQREEKVSIRNYIPNVIEPSFGIGRIIYSILEHAYYVREPTEEEKASEKNVEKTTRCVLSLPARLAPIKVAVLPLSTSAELQAPSHKINRDLIDMNLPTKIDDSGVSIGRKYARADELGVPYAITIDFDFAKDNTVTLRDRDSCEQIRADVDTVLMLVLKLVNGRTTWKEVYGSHTQVLRQ